MALTTLNAVKDMAGISRSDASRDTQIQALITGTSGYIKDFLGRTIEQTSYTEYHSGNNSPILLTRQFPVISIERICVDPGGHSGQSPNAFPAAYDLVEGVDFCLLPGQNGLGSSGMIRRISGVWPGRMSRAAGIVENLPPVPSGNILVEYTAGYAPGTVPAGLQMAVNAFIVRGLSFASQGMAVSSESYEDGSASYFGSAEAAKLLGSVERTLAKYRSLVV